MLQENNKCKYTKNLIIIFSFLLLSIFSVIFLLSTHILFSGADLLFHLKRILELEDSFHHGVIFPQYSFNQFHGSAVMTLYPYINLWPILLFSLFIKSKILLIYSWIIFNIFISLLISFYSSKPFNKSILTSYLFSCIYSLSNVYTSYIFYDADFGAITALAFLPLIIFGFIRLINDKSVIELSLGLIGIIFSHVLSIFIVIGLLTIWILINYHIITKYIIRSLSKVVIIVSLVTSIEWIPVIYFGIHNYNDIASIGFPPMKGTPFSLLIHNSIGLSYFLSIFALIGIILGIIYFKKFNKYLKQMFVISLLTVIVCSSIFPWDLTNHGLFKIIKIFQFSWRFYVIPQVILSYIFAKCIIEYATSNKLRYILFSGLLLILLLCNFNIQCRNSNYGLSTISYNNKQITNTTNVYNENINKSLIKSKYVDDLPKAQYKFTKSSQINGLDKINGNGALSFEDYYPKEPKYLLKYINNNLIYMPDHRNSLEFSHIRYNTYKFINRYKDSRMIIPIFCYKGEKLKIYVNNKPVRFNVTKNNLVKILNINKGTNILRISYIPNKVVIIISIIMSLLGLIIICKLMYVKIVN